MNKFCYLAVLIVLGLSAINANATETLSVKEKMQYALKLGDRTQADKKRDHNRLPIAAMEFAGLKDNMKVIEFNPGSDFWYSKLLEPVLRDNGELLLAGNSDWMDEWLASMPSDRIAKLKRIHVDMDWSNETREFVMDAVDFKTNDADMLLNIREYHNLPDKNRTSFNQAAFKALKPGGIYVVIDHSRRHMKENSFEVYRREDPIRVIKEVQNAGFVFTKYSNMFYRPGDDLSLELRRRSVIGNSDRFFFVFHKPK